MNRRGTETRNLQAFSQCATDPKMDEESGLRDCQQTVRVTVCVGWEEDRWKAVRPAGVALRHGGGRGCFGWHRSMKSFH